MKNNFSKQWDAGGESRSIIQGLNLFTSRNLFKSLKSILMVVALLSLSSNVWGDSKTYSYTDFDGCGASGGAAFSKDLDDFNFNSSSGRGNTSSGYLQLMSGSTLTVSSSTATLTSIAFTCTANTTSNYGPAKITLKSGEKGSYSYSNKVGTWTYATGTKSVTFSLSAQARVTQIVVTYTASKTLSSISVKTAPSKVTYTEGDNFDPTGLVITKTYSDATPEDWAYASHASDFTFNPSTSTALTTSHKSVTITVGDKSTTQSITVNAKVAAVVKLSEAGTVTTVSETRYIGDSYTLPSTCSQTCGTKTFVGWSSVEIQNSAAKPTVSTYHEPGAQVTLAANNTFYAVFADASSGGGASSTADYTLSFSQLTSGTNYNSYTAAHSITVSSKDWTLYGNQSLGAYLRVGGKSLTNENRTLTSTATLSSKAIAKVSINHNGVSNANLTVNSITVEGSTSSTFANNVITVTKTSPSVSSSGTLDFQPTSGTWAANSYFRITVNVSNSKASNYGFDINTIAFYPSGGTTYSNYTTSCISTYTLLFSELKIAHFYGIFKSFF